MGWLENEDPKAVLLIGGIVLAIILLVGGSLLYDAVKPKHHCDYDCERILNQYAPLNATPDVNATIDQLMHEVQ